MNDKKVNVRLFTVRDENLRELFELNGIYPIIDNFNGEKHIYKYAKSDELFDVFNNRKIQVDKEDLIYVFDREKAIENIERGHKLFAVRNARSGGFMFMFVKKNAIKKYIKGKDDIDIHDTSVKTSKLPEDKKVDRKPIKDMDKALADLKEEYDEKARYINKKKRDR